MRIAIFGGSGLLGQGLTKVLMRKHVVFTPTRDQPQITDQNFSRLADWLTARQIDMVINAVGLTDVDYCRAHPEESFRVNCQLATILAAISSQLGSAVIHFSCYDVFDGSLATDRSYQERDPYQPFHTHGANKAAVEIVLRSSLRDCAIIRLGHLFGPGRPSFIDNVLDQALHHQPVKAVLDQIISPTYTIDVAIAIAGLIESGPIPGGVYHLVNEGRVSPAECAGYILSQAGISGHIHTVKSAEVHAVPQPSNCTLANTKLPPLPAWQDAMNRHLKSIRT